MQSPFTHSESLVLLSFLDNLSDPQARIQVKGSEPVNVLFLREKIRMIEKNVRPAPPSVITWEIVEGGI